MATTAVLVRIGGCVQGAGCRAWAETEAVSLVLSGWVRNRRDGTVEAMVFAEWFTALHRTRAGLSR